MDRIFSGALTLLGIMVALFTFAYIQYVDHAGFDVDQQPYKVLLWIVGVLVVGSGVSALFAHILPPRQPNQLLHWGFAGVLVVATVSPFLILIFV